MIDARTRSTSPALRATVAMINSGALPKVAFSSPPTASPVRVAICSVEWTIRLAAGMMASAAEKKTTGGAASARSSTTAMGTNARSQLTEGFRDTSARSPEECSQFCRWSAGGALAFGALAGHVHCSQNVECPMPNDHCTPVTIEHWTLAKRSWRRPTLPRPRDRSTIGADRLNDRVRDGNGCGPVALVASKMGARDSGLGTGV